MRHSQLHEQFRCAIKRVSSTSEEVGLGRFLEQGGVENFLTGLLFIQLCANDRAVTRENRMETGRADITLDSTPIELKQLNLVDSKSEAPQNLTNDLKRHEPIRGLGIMYMSSVEIQPPFKTGSKTPKHSVHSAHNILKEWFGRVYPMNWKNGLIRELNAEPGTQVRLYAFIVSEPKKEIKKRSKPAETS